MAKKLHKFMIEASPETGFRTSEEVFDLIELDAESGFYRYQCPAFYGSLNPSAFDAPNVVNGQRLIATFWCEGDSARSETKASLYAAVEERLKADADRAKREVARFERLLERFESGTPFRLVESKFDF